MDEDSTCTNRERRIHTHTDTYIIRSSPRTRAIPSVLTHSRLFIPVRLTDEAHPLLSLPAAATGTTEHRAHLALVASGLDQEQCHHICNALPAEHPQVLYDPKRWTPSAYHTGA